MEQKGEKWATIGPLAKRHSNGVSLAGRWWHDILCWSGSSMQRFSKALNMWGIIRIEFNNKATAFEKTMLQHNNGSTALERAKLQQLNV